MSRSTTTDLDSGEAMYAWTSFKGMTRADWPKYQAEGQPLGCTHHEIDPKTTLLLQVFASEAVVIEEYISGMLKRSEFDRVMGKKMPKDTLDQLLLVRFPSVTCPCVDCQRERNLAYQQQYG